MSRTIIAGYDGRAESHSALRVARDLVDRLGARLAVIAVAEPIATSMAPGVAVVDAALAHDYEEHLEREAESLVQGTPGAEARVLRGAPARVLVDVGHGDVDLLVMGSRGYGPARSVLVGSVARQVADHAPCPVVVVPRGARAGLEQAVEDVAAQPV
jgi:nucleotide-binding universal stress UspA family protein